MSYLVQKLIDDVAEVGISLFHTVNIICLYGSSGFFLVMSLGMFHSLVKTGYVPSEAQLYWSIAFLFFTFFGLIYHYTERGRMVMYGMKKREG